MDETKQSPPRIWPDDQCVLRFPIEATEPHDDVIEQMMRDHGEQIIAALREQLPKSLEFRLVAPEEPIGGTITQAIDIGYGKMIGARISMVWSDHVDRRGVEVYVDEESPVMERARLMRVARWIGIGAIAGGLGAWFAGKVIFAGALVGMVIGLVVSGVLGAIQPNKLGLASPITSTNQGLANEIRRLLHAAFPDEAVS